GGRALAASPSAVLAALLKLRQAVCDPRLVDMDAARGVRASAKYDAFFDIVDQQVAEGHRVLVFSQFTSMLALLAHGLRGRGIEPLVLTGATRDRQKQVDAFEGGASD